MQLYSSNHSDLFFFYIEMLHKSSFSCSKMISEDVLFISLLLNITDFITNPNFPVINYIRVVIIYRFL